MKAATLKTFTVVHTWAGLIGGMALFIAFYAGALDMFHDRLDAWSDPVRQLNAPSDPDAVDRLVADATTRYEPTRERFFVHLPDEVVAGARIEWRDGVGRQATSYRLDEPGGVARNVNRDAHSRLADFIDELHFTLGLPVIPGRYLLGLICIVYGVALISGVIIHLPRLLRDLFALRTGKNRKQFWLDTHNVVGVLSLPFHIMFMITSALFTINFVAILGINFIVYQGGLTSLAESLQIAPHREETGVATAMRPASDWLAAARARFPDMQPETMIVEHYGDQHTTVTVRGAVERNLLHEAVVVVDGATAEVLGAEHPSNSRPSQVAVKLVQSLHFGDFGGDTLRWLYFTLALLGAWLFYSGNLLWLETRRKRRRSIQPWNHRLLAGLTVGVCIGCMWGISMLLLANRILPVELDPRALWETRVYYLSFFAAVCWALWRKPLPAATELLMACAVTTALIPIFSALRAVESAGWVQPGVDIVAAAGALVFALMAWLTRRSARAGTPAGVWAHR